MKSFLTGLATGLAIGYLTAPRSGKETRDQLSEAANKQTQGLKEQWNKTVARANKLVEEAKSNLNSSKPEPNLFADIEAGKLDKYMDEPQRIKNKRNQNAEDMADAARA